MKKRFIHIHVPKCAGSTFNAVLKRHFGRRMLRYDDRKPGYIFTDAEKAGLLESNRGIECFSGHALRYPAPPRRKTLFNYITFLRHPLERIVSLYAYEKKVQGTDFKFSTFEDWVSARLKAVQLQRDNAVCNYQAFHIMGTRNMTAVSFEKAAGILDTFYFVGISERFDTALVLLGRKLGLKLSDLCYIPKNITGSKQQVRVSPEIEKQLRAVNRIDYALYAHASERFEKDLSRYAPDWRIATERLRQMNTRYAKYAIGEKIQPVTAALKRRVHAYVKPWLPKNP